MGSLGALAKRGSWKPKRKHPFIPENSDHMFFSAEGAQTLPCARTRVVGCLASSARLLLSPAVALACPVAD